MSKKCKSPINFLILVSICGYATLRLCEGVIKNICSFVKKENVKFDECVIYADYTDDLGLVLRKGDKIKIIARDTDTTIIATGEKIDDVYCINTNTLMEISNFRISQEEN